ncbi:MAG: terminase family protein [Deltaproteobacteria bacterium]
MPKRWSALRYHSEQARLWTEKKRFKAVVAGRRSGKTELAKRRLVLALAEKKSWGDPRYFAAAPTREQAKRIFWKDLKALIPKSWIKRVSESELSIATKFGSELFIVGLDKPERIEGVAWDGAVMDEYANMRPGAWQENVRPALSDRQGWCWFVGVPEGLNHYKDLADYAKKALDPEWGFYSWPSSDILPKGEVDAARRILDEKTFRQEYEASFEGSSGRVYYAYDSIAHEDKSVELMKGLPIVVACDFNVDPCVWILCQTDGKKIRVFDEVALRNTNTVDMARELLRRYEGHEEGFLIYGDAAGSARTTAGKSDYALLLEMGFKRQKIKRANPAVRDRVNAVNAVLRNTAGEIRLSHHPRCKRLKRDFETVEWARGTHARHGSGGELDKRNFERTHATDALGYFIEYEFPLKQYMADIGKKFYK